MFNFPEKLYRPTDNECFVLVDPKNGLYSIECSLLEFPNNLHQQYSFETLNNSNFSIFPQKSKKEKSVKLSDYKLGIEIQHRSHMEIPWKDRDESWFRTDQWYCGIRHVLNLIDSGDLVE